LQFMVRVGQTFNTQLPVRAFVQVARPCRRAETITPSPEQRRNLRVRS
jgi:hypothetical protein